MLGFTRYGKGGIIVLSDAWMFANQGIDKDDNLILAINALSYPAHGRKFTVTFDEYHHGYHHEADKREDITSLIGGTTRIGLLQLLVAFAILALAASRRFGRPVPLREGERPRSEYLTSMATLLQKAGLITFVAAELDRKFTHDMAAILCLNPNPSLEEILEAARVRYPGVEHELRELLRSENDTENRSVNDTALLALTLRRNRFRKELTKKR